jgi:hypothetical protein
MKFLNNNNMEVVPCEPYVSLFSRLKIKTEDRHFDITEAIEEESQAMLDTLQNTTTKMHLRKI